MNLKQKSFLFVAVAMTLLLIVYIGVSRSFLTQAKSRRLEERRQSTEAAARSLDDFFLRATNRIEYVASFPLLLNGLEALEQEAPGKELPTSDTLHYVFLSSDIFKHVYLVNDRGHVIWSEPRDQSIRNTEYAPFAEVRDSFRGESTGTAFSVWQSPSGEAMIHLASILASQDGTVAGYLIGVISANNPSITAALAAQSNSINTQLATMDGRTAGLVVASSDPNRVMRQLEYRELVLDRIRKGPPRVLSSDSVPALKSIVSYMPLEKGTFFVSSDEREDIALQDVQELRRILPVVGILSLSVVMATLFFVVRSFTRPVEILTEEARRIGAGDMNVSFTTNRSDEVGALAKTLEDMKLRLKASYDRLLQSEKMALMGQVVAGIAHELNNPLTIVIGHTELMMMKGVDEQQRQPLTRIHDGAERASKIVKNLLTFARQKRPERKLSDINAILTKTIDLRAYELKVSNIELITQFAPGLPQTLCDPHQLQQVFLNLIVNAEQAMLEANGRGRLVIATKSKNDQILIAVEDDGPGIAPENLRRVFDPFFTTKAVGKGTGLGLAICQGIIAEHGGRLAVESAGGAGATFTVELPIVSRTAEEQPSVVGLQAPHTPQAHKVLVVDDDAHMRELFSDILRGEGHEVVTASSGKEALADIEKHRFDLLITDIKMPDMDGRSFQEHLRNERSPLASRIVFVTGDLMNPTTLRFLEECGSPWLAKPFEISAVRETVRKMLASS